MEQISVSKFKATCLAVLEQVRASGNPVVITKRGAPLAMVNPVVVRPSASWLGSATGTAFITGDLVESPGELDPLRVVDDWDRLTGKPAEKASSRKAKAR
jgi:prevent-host-death family protein